MILLAYSKWLSLIRCCVIVVAQRIVAQQIDVLKAEIACQMIANSEFYHKQQMKCIDRKFCQESDTFSLFCLLCFNKSKKLLGHGFGVFEMSWKSAKNDKTFCCAKLLYCFTPYFKLHFWEHLYTQYFALRCMV